MARLSDKAMIASLTVGMIPFSELDKKMTSRVHDELLHNPKRAGKWMKEKMNRDDVRPILKLVEDGRVYHRRVSRPFGDEGGRLLPVVRVTEYCKTMGQFKRDFDNEKSRIIATWDQILMIQKERLGPDFVIESYPSREKLQRILKFEWKIHPVPDWANVHDKDHVLFQIEQEVADELIAQCKEEERKHLADSIGYLWARLNDIVDRMRTACADKSSKVYDATIQALETENQIIRELNFTNDPEIEQITSEIENRLCGWSAKAIRKDLQLKLKLGRIAETIQERIRSRIEIGVISVAA